MRADEAGLPGGDSHGVLVFPFGDEGDDVWTGCLVGIAEAFGNGSADGLLVDFDRRPDGRAEQGVSIDDGVANSVNGMIGGRNSLKKKPARSGDRAGLDGPEAGRTSHVEIRWLLEWH